MAMFCFGFFSFYWTDIHILHFQAANFSFGQLFIQGVTFSKNLPKTIPILSKILFAIIIVFPNYF